MNKKIVVGFLVALATYLTIIFVTPLFIFKPWFDWWKTHQPANGITQTCLPLALLAYQSSAEILFWIASLFMVNENQKLSYTWQAEFLLNVMGRWAVDLAPNGFLTPYALCTSIAPQPGDSFYKPLPTVSGDGDRWPSFRGWPAEQPKTITSKYSQRSLWQGVLASWGCAVNPKDPTRILPDTGNVWQNSPSNFLFTKYGIPYDSELCESFVLGTDADADGKEWFKDALAALLGVDADSGAGGWVGLLRGGGDWGSYGLFSMEAYVWAHDITKLPDPTSVVKKCGGAGWASAGMQALNTGVMGAMLFSAVAFPWGALAIGGLGLLGGVLGLAQYKCL